MLLVRIVPKIVREAFEFLKRHIVVSINAELDGRLPFSAAIACVSPGYLQVLAFDSGPVVCLLNHQAAVTTTAQISGVEGVKASRRDS